MKSQLAVFAVLAAAPAIFAQDAPRKAFTVLQEACGSCHGLNRLETSKNRSEWQDTVDRMMGNGADVKSNEVPGLVGYLVRYYGESIEINKVTAKQLQDEADMTQAEADAIIKARSDNGAFKSYADLQKVPGLDAKRIDPIKDRFRY